MSIFSWFASVCFSQINASQLNKKLLEHEIKTLVDSVRLAHNLAPLFNDSILYAASNHHANYLLSKGVLSHEEIGIKDFLTPQDRANYYGAPTNYYVGENIVFGSYNANLKIKDRYFQTTDYKELARALVYSWVNSKGHFKNMINPDYQVTGLAISIDTLQNRVYACQKFAQVLYTYSFEESPTFFPYSTIDQGTLDAILSAVPKDLSYPFGLRYDKKEQCSECKSIWENRPPISVRLSRGNFILRIEDSEFVKELIQEKKDGFAIELVPFDAYACGNPAYENEPSRRNGLKRTSGRILQPIYREDLIKGFKKRKKKKELTFVNYLLKADSVSFLKRFGSYKLINFEAQYFEMKLGKVPKDMNSWWNHNLVYIHKKQICHFLYLTNYPGELNVEMIDVPYYPPVPVNNYKFSLDHFNDTVTLFYNPGQSVHIGSDLEKMISIYQEKNVRITSLQIDGYSSVEGDARSNEVLHAKRASTILNKLNSLMDTDTICRVNSKVDWEHFYKNVENSQKWKFLFPKSKDEITSYLLDVKNDRPLDILSQERRVQVIVSGVRDLNKKNAFYYINRDLNDLFVKDKKGVLTCKDVDKLELLYEKAYYFTTVDTLKQKDFLKLKIPKFNGGMPHSLDHDIAFYRYDLLKDSVAKTELSLLESKVESVFNTCGAAEHLSPEFSYLSACLLVEKIKNKGKKITSEDLAIKKAFSRLNLLLTWYNADSTFLVDVSKANLNIINILCETIDAEQIYEYNDIVNASLIHIIEFYRKTNKLNASNVVSLGKTLCYFKNIPLAVDLCKDYLYDDEVLKLYLPLSYTHSSFLTSSDELEFEVYFHNLLIEAKKRLSSSDWCNLFYGKFGIPFQVMDNEQLHTAFCETCPNRVTEVFEEFK